MFDRVGFDLHTLIIAIGISYLLIKYVGGFLVALYIWDSVLPQMYCSYAIHEYELYMANEANYPSEIATILFEFQKDCDSHTFMDWYLEESRRQS